MIAMINVFFTTLLAFQTLSGVAPHGVTLVGGTASSGLSWHLIDETPQYANITQAQWSAILP